MLQQATHLGFELETDRIDLEHAQMIVEDPDLACAYSRDGWVEVDEESARAAGADR